MHLHTPLKYKAWADGRTLDAVAQIDRHIHTAQFQFALQQLNHMVRVEELFRARLSGTAEPHDSTNTPRLPELDELALRLDESNHWLQDYANGLGEDQFVQQIHFAFVDGKKGALTREEVLYHLINHGTYHRGAIGRALDLANAPRPADTFTVFVHATELHRREAWQAGQPEAPRQASQAVQPPWFIIGRTAWPGFNAARRLFQSLPFMTSAES